MNTAAVFDSLRHVAGRVIKPLSITSAVGMWIVLIMGATVTNTGSARGCADTWPLCRGQFIPQFAVSTAIEFSHRTVVAILSVLLIALAICVWLVFRDRFEIKLLSAVMVAFLFVQSGLGAWAVMSPQNPAVLALHFGVSLIAFASVLLVAVLVFEPDQGEVLRNRPLPRYFSAYLWGITIFSFLDVYLGAYVRHRGADDACSGWPLCNGQIIPAISSGLVGPAFAHRLAAVVLSVGIGGAIAWSYRFRQVRPDLFTASLTAGALVVLEALSGALVEATGLDLFSALAHAALVALLFGNLAFLCLHVTRVAEARTAENRAKLAVSY